MAAYWSPSIAPVRGRETGAQRVAMLARAWVVP